ncbi:hypothetical protein C8R44DRAFT_863981 [Mycena epipterygia]|nr:hypothetical protein C8R44DRAFT_863981 [Mycena epipterygia]
MDIVGVSGRAMPISGNITAYVGRLPQSNGGDIFILWNYAYHKFVVVQVVDRAYDDEEDAFLLGKIQSLLDTIDFERDEVFWAYLIDQPTGPRIIQRPRDHYRIRCDFLWAERVDVSEVEIHRLYCRGQGLGRGVWRGKKVDINVGCDDLGLKYIERETRGLKAVRGMDLTYDVVAHVFRGGFLIGILTEPSELSRPIRRSDRAAVFAAFAKLERAFMLHKNLMDNQRILIDEKGRVRLLDLNNIICYAPHERKKFEEHAQDYHWDTLQQMFQDLEHWPLNSAPWPQHFWKPESTILARTPSPERLLLITVSFITDVTPQFGDNKRNNRRQKQSSKGLRGNPKTLSIGTTPLGRKAQSLALATISRNIPRPGDPPPYSEFPPTHGKLPSRLLLLAPEPEDTGSGASIVEL